MLFSKQLVLCSIILLLAQGSFVQCSIERGRGVRYSIVKVPALSPDVLLMVLTGRCRPFDYWTSINYYLKRMILEFAIPKISIRVVNQNYLH